MTSTSREPSCGSRRSAARSKPSSGSASCASRLFGASSVERSRAASSSAIGCAPGTIDATSHCSDPGSDPFRSAGTTPARATLDLPGSTRPHKGDEAGTAAEPGDHVGHEPISSEEVAGVCLLERVQPFERARHHRRLTRRCKWSEALVVQQDLLFEAPQLRRRLEAELLADPGAGTARMRAAPPPAAQRGRGRASAGSPDAPAAGSDRPGIVSSPISSGPCPQRRSASTRVSIASRRSSSRRMVSVLANSSYEKSCSAAPRQSPRAARKVCDAAAGSVVRSFLASASAASNAWRVERGGIRRGSSSRGLE